MKLSTLPLLVVLLGACATASAGSARDGADPEVEAVVNRLFDAMRAADGPAAEALFHSEARLFSIGEQNGAPVMQASSSADFIRAVGAPRTQVWDERIANLEIHRDGNLATAWMDYAFYVDGTFSHCGVNAFQLYRSAEGWKIIHITDTRRMQDCRVP